MLKDLNLTNHPADGQILTGNINVCNVQSQSHDLQTATLILSGNPLRQIVFAFPDNLAPDEPYTAVIQLPRKALNLVESVPVSDAETGETKYVEPTDEEVQEALAEAPTIEAAKKVAARKAVTRKRK